MDLFKYNKRMKEMWKEGWFIAYFMFDELTIKSNNDNALKAKRREILTLKHNSSSFFHCCTHIQQSCKNVKR